VKRRRFLTGSAIFWVATRLGAQERRRRLAVLGLQRDWRTTKEIVSRLRDLGYVEGRNLAIDVAYSDGRPGEFESLARELARQRVDIIVAAGVMAVTAARQATSTIPIVMLMGADPLALGFVSSLARPGGNVTGLSWGDDVEFTDKLVELVHATLPSARTIGVIYTSHDPAHQPYLQTFKKAAGALGLQVTAHGIGAAEDIPGAFRQMKASRVDVVAVLLDHFTIALQDLIEQQAVAQRMPIATWSGFGYGSAVVRFGPKVDDQPRRAAEYVARILKGAKPGDLPVERSTRYELIVNVKSAKALGLSVPDAVLLRADSVIR
jgi:putative ABC transport system substrate-binding protein